MVRSSDNEMALFQEPDYLQVKEMVGMILTTTHHELLGSNSGWKLLTPKLHDNFV